MAHKTSLSDLQYYATLNKGKCLSKEFISAETPAEWACEKGHRFSLAYFYVKRGLWCNACSTKKRNDEWLEFYKELAVSRGGKLLSKEYITSKTKVKWQCAKQHTWYQTPGIVKKGNWCHACARENRLLKIEELQKFAQKKGGKLLSDKYTGLEDKLKWKCSAGHVWDQTFRVVKYSGTWCLLCMKEKKRATTGAMKKIALEKGGRLISKKYINNSTPLKWECAKGHVWEAVPGNVKNGNWCKLCSNDYKKPSIEQLQELAISRGGKLLTKGYINSRTKMKWQCAEGHTWLQHSHEVKNGKTWCPFCFREKNNSSLKGMQTIAKQRGGKLISKKYTDSHTLLTWQCKQGHSWKATPGNIKKGNWCRSCSGIGRRLPIDILQKIAISKGGKLLTANYLNSLTKMKWRCAKGHTWMASGGSIKNTGSWCPQCWNLRRGKK